MPFFPNVTSSSQELEQRRQREQLASLQVRHRPDATRTPQEQIKMMLRPYIKPLGQQRPHPPWLLPALCRAYNWPSGLPGGSTIAIGELGGGHVASDIAMFCTANSLPMPNIVDVSVRGARNNGDPTDPASAEVTGDIEVALAAYSIATGKPATIRVYFAPNDETGIEDATMAALADGCDGMTWSWGASEIVWGSAALDSLETAMAKAVAGGMFVTAASGDNSADDGGGSIAVDAPASCPSVLGCGGTTKTVSREIVWGTFGMPDGNGTGGGYSAHFPRQAWQIGAPAAPHHLGRMVPDVASVADPYTGLELIINGTPVVYGGTSFSSPLWAGLLGACGRKLGPVSHKLWLNQSTMTDITVGSNGVYLAGRGPDPCTGLGCPNGRIAPLFAH